jgi:hypothetical protein
MEISFLTIFETMDERSVKDKQFTVNVVFGCWKYCLDQNFIEAMNEQLRRDTSNRVVFMVHALCINFWKKMS